MRYEKMNVNVKDVSETKARIQELIKILEGSTCEKLHVEELKEILEKVGAPDNQAFFSQYEDIWDDAADALMFAGVSVDECSCDPLRRHIPKDKQVSDPDS